MSVDVSEVTGQLDMSSVYGDLEPSVSGPELAMSKIKLLEWLKMKALQLSFHQSALTD